MTKEKPLQTGALGTGVEPEGDPALASAAKDRAGGSKALDCTLARNRFYGLRGQQNLQRMHFRIPCSSAQAANVVRRTLWLKHW